MNTPEELLKGCGKPTDVVVFGRRYNCGDMNIFCPVCRVKIRKYGEYDSLSEILK